jgi:anti-sigma B factor antagonist
VKQVRHEGATLIVSLAGEIDLHHTPEVHKALVVACERQPPRLVINLAQVTYMDSSGIGTLVEVLRKVKAYRGALFLCCLSERVLSVFEITKLDHFFKIVTTEQEALTA